MPLRLSKHRVLLDGIPLNESQSTSLPSAATLDIWSVTGNVIPISGSATVSGFTPAPQPGTKRTLLCTGTPSFTHSTNLLLPGSADYTATAGDRIEVLAVTTTQFRLSIIKASVLPDVQFSKDASGNVTGLLGPDGEQVYIRDDLGLGSSIATRIPGGNIDALTNQLGNTSSLGARLADAFDAVQIIYANKCATPTAGMLVSASTAANLTSTSNSVGTWVTGTIGTAPARVSATEPSFTFSSWIPLDGTSKIVYARLYIPSAGNTESSVATFYAGAGGEQWATMAGDEWKVIKQAGDFVTTPGTFTATFVNAFSAIAGIRYRSRGVVHTVMGVGDSITQGTKGNISDNGFLAKAVRQLKVAGHKIEYCNFGVGGQKSFEYQPRALSALTTIKPDVMIYSAFSPNDNSANITAASTTDQRRYLAEVRDAAKTARCRIVPMTGMPRCTGNEQTSFWTNTQDDMRKSLNAQVRELPLYLDLDFAVSLNISPGTASGVKTGYMNADLIHLSEAGNDGAVPESVRAISKAIGILL